MEMIERIKGDLPVPGVRGARPHEETDRQEKTPEQSFFHDRLNTPCPDNGHRRDDVRPPDSGRGAEAASPYILTAV